MDAPDDGSEPTKDLIKRCKRKLERCTDDDKASKLRKKLRKLEARELESKAAALLAERAPADDSAHDVAPQERPPASASAAKPASAADTHSTTLLLCYQYVEPAWSESDHLEALEWFKGQGEAHKLGGRMRVAREGLNCTLTGSASGVRAFTSALKAWDPAFAKTDFKLTDGLPDGQAFHGAANVFPVDELVNYGLPTASAPQIKRGGVHLDAPDFHAKLQENNTVVIDVRNTYEAAIGHFQPPASGAAYIDPGMRKSTEFPKWLRSAETREKLKGKQVLMYCTGGVRCERASSLLNAVVDEAKRADSSFGVNGVFQLQGGVERYLKEFPDDGGYWAGKNYTFDKRFAHGPANVDLASIPVLSKCCRCDVPWDRFRGKKRCACCGVPVLVCSECLALGDGDAAACAASSVMVPKAQRVAGLPVKCPLCTAEGAAVKTDDKWLAKVAKLQKLESAAPKGPAPNPDNVTRLYVGNLDWGIDEAALKTALRGVVTHVQWMHDRVTGDFRGCGFVEMKTPDDAGVAVGVAGTKVLGRPMKVRFSAPRRGDTWPPIAGLGHGAVKKDAAAIAAAAAAAAAADGLAPDVAAAMRSGADEFDGDAAAAEPRARGELNFG